MIWAGVACALIVPVAIAATSPFLPGRNIEYVIAGFAGIICLGLLLLQPLLAAGYLPGLGGMAGRKLHRMVGAGIVLAVALHIGGLYLTSAPDTVDALLLVSPTPFSVYGVTAMWGVVLTALLVALRRRMGLRYSVWRLIHNGVALVVVVATVIHAVQIEGTMGTVSKWGLCIAVLLVTGMALVDLRVLRPLLNWRESQTDRTG